MPKVYKVHAKVSTAYSAYVQVPDDWTEQDILEWYEYNGAGDEFTEDEEKGMWEFLQPKPTDYDGHPDMVFLDLEG